MKPRQRDFDAHIYFNDETRALATALRDKALRELQDQEIFVSRMVDHKIGPHPRPMFELVFGKEKLTEIILWLIANRQGLAVLIHQVTGSDIFDHSQGALWMGEVLPLDFSIFDT